MTNEPPTGDGEELVEADPPRPAEPSASDRLDPTASNAMEVGESGEAYEFESRSDAFKGMPSGDAVWRDTPPIPSLLGEVQELASVEKETVDEAAIDNDPGDSVFDDLTYKVIDAMAGNIDPPIVAPTSGTDELESNDGSDATAQTDDLGRGPASGAGQQLDLSQMPGKFRPPADERSHLTRILEAPAPFKLLILGFIAAGGIVVVALTGGLVGRSDAVASVAVTARRRHRGDRHDSRTHLGGDERASREWAARGLRHLPDTSGQGRACRPYYASATSKNTLWPVRRHFERLITVREPIPTNPVRPLEYKLVVSGAAGPTIELVISGSPGDPLSCVRLVNGTATAGGANDVCGQITAPDTVYMRADLSAYGAGPLKFEWFASEIEGGATSCSVITATSSPRRRYPRHEH